MAGRSRSRFRREAVDTPSGQNLIPRLAFATAQDPGGIDVILRRTLDANNPVEAYELILLGIFKISVIGIQLRIISIKMPFEADASLV